nr:immunoglobulin light chain junction region [Macaca mulatta]MOW15774.1 immunoglobulin light chain junction region [Macaca mulatta]MOW17068.1 immunoglobulin light chain junction region [Macaca mulatta]MOW17581.1 immunoglobulin light chain junction region [Macaca mulatta]MOW17994.1 immunoglobulin light chain junction region [Macaca mulatta]
DYYCQSHDSSLSAQLF